MNGVAQARAFIRAGRRSPSGWLGRYVAALGGLLTVMMLWTPVRALVARLSTSTAPDPSRVGVSVAFVLAGFGVLIMFAGSVGPMVLSPADAYWLLRSPLPGRGVLTRTALVLLVVSALAGAVLGAVGLAALGVAGHVLLRVLAAVVIGAAVAVAGTASALLGQPSPNGPAAVRATGSAVLVGAVVLAVLVMMWPGIPGRAVLGALPRLPIATLMALAGAAASGAALLGWWAWRRLAVFPARAVLHASSRVGTATGAVVGMQPAVLGRMVEEDYWRGRRLRSRRWPTLPAPAALAFQEWRTLSRRPARLVLTLMSTPLPALARIAVGRSVPAAVVLFFALALLAAGLATSGVRRDADSPVLRRLFGTGGTPLRVARWVLPTLLAGGWSVLAVYLMVAAGLLPAGPWWLLCLGAAPAFGAAVLRMATRGPIAHTSIPVTMGGGWVPTGWLLWAASGLDIAVPGCAVLLLALADPPSGGFSTLVAAQAVLGPAAAGWYLWRHRTREG